RRKYGLRIYQFQGCDLLPAHQEVHNINRQAAHPVLLLERGQGRHARRSTRRLHGRRNEDRPTCSQEGGRRLRISTRTLRNGGSIRRIKYNSIDNNLIVLLVKNETTKDVCVR